jgi:hypothetical protein
VSNNIRVTQTLDDHQVLAELLRQQKEMGKVIDKWYQMAQAASRAGQKTDRTTSKWVKNLRDFAIGMTGINSVSAGILAIVDQVRREYDNLQQRQNNSGKTNIGYEGAMSRALFKTQGLLTGSDLRSISADYARKSEYQVSEAQILQLISSAVSARGVTNRKELKQALDTSVAVAKISPHMDAEEASSVAAGSASFSARYGVTPEQGIGFLMKVGQKSNILELDSLVNNMVPAIGAMTSIGFDIDDAGAFVSTLSQGIDDPSGETTRTAAINFANSLRERFRRSDGSFNPDAAMQALYNDPELVRRFFEGGEFGEEAFGDAAIGKGRAQPTLEAMLTPGTVYHRQFQSFRPQIGNFDNAAATYEAYRADLEANTPVSRGDRAFQHSIQRYQLDNPEEAMSGVLRNRVRELYQAMGYTDLEQRTNAVMTDIESGGNWRLSETAETFETKARRLEGGRAPRYAGPGGYGAAPTYTPASPDEMRDAETYRELANLLRRIDETMASGLNGIQENQKRPQVGARQPVRPASAGLGRK